MLVNPVFSSLRLRKVPRVRQVLEQAGIIVEQTDTGPNGATPVIVRSAIEGGVDAIVVCGGDGTVFDVLQGAAGSGVPIGVLPFGTGNVLVQNLGLPRDPIAAARALLKAKPIEVPLGHISCGGESLYFAMSAGVGGHAAMMRSAYRYAKHRTGRLAYFAAGLEILATYPLVDFAMEITTTSGDEHRRRACELIAVRVGQLNLWRTGGGLERPSLRVASVEGASRLRLVRASFDSLILQSGSRRGEDSTHSAAIYEDAVSVRITPSSSKPLVLQADGEIVATVTSEAPAVIAMSAENAVFLSRKA